MVVELYKDSPEYENKEAKYILYFELLPQIEDQSNIVCDLSNGFSMNDEESLDLTIPKEDFFYEYSYNNEKVLVFKKAAITLKYGKSNSVQYNTLDNPDNIRFSFDSACEMKLNDKIVRNDDGTPNIELTPSIHAIKCMFNELPADEVKYQIDLIDTSENATKFQDGKIKLVLAPWDEQ